VVSGSEPPLTCWICGMAVSLESCAIDEHGMAVHEDCSVRKTASKASASTPQHKLPPKPQRNPQTLATLEIVSETAWDSRGRTRSVDGLRGGR
jgi:hypothetical protein